MKTKHEILEEYSRSYTGEILPTIHVTVALDAMEEYKNQFVPSVEPGGYTINQIRDCAKRFQNMRGTTQEQGDKIIEEYISSISPVSSDKKKVEGSLEERVSELERKMNNINPELS